MGSADESSRTESGIHELSTSDPSHRHDLRVVGIGASAGGLEALRPLVAALPESTNLCFVVIQHLSPQHRSMMVDLLARETRIPVRAITTGTVLKPNIIYVTPPNCDVLYRSGKLMLRTPLEAKGPKPSIDQFFASIAAELGARAIAVVLSGTGSDGANGIRAVKANGGVTFAQDPGSAKYESMPRAAIMSGGADIVLPPREIAAKLALTARGQDLHLQMAEKVDNGSNPFQTIIQYIRRHTGIDFSKYKEATLRRRITRRMTALKIRTLKDYVAHIDSDREEIDVLTKSFMISVTSFFRDEKAFAAIDAVLDKLVAEKKTGETLRIWVPACATGEEAYSIALLLAKKMQARRTALRVQIFGTDIDALSTTQARRGEFTAKSVAHLDRALLRNSFVKVGKTWRVNKPIRDMVVFSRHDVVHDPPFKNIDLISCRNLLIYFKPVLQEHVFKSFHYALRPGGYLFLGRSESLGASRSLFSVVDFSHKIFHRRDVTVRPHLIPRTHDSSPQAEHGAAAVRLPRPPGETGTQAGRNKLTEIYAPASILVTDEGYPLHFYGDVSPWVHIGRNSGSVDFNLMVLIDAAFRSDLRVLLHRARRHGTACRGQHREAPESGKLVRLAVHPVEVAESEDPQFLVCFEEAEPLPARRGKKSPERLDDTTAQHIVALEEELKATKENLQTVVEELETSNEELLATNEELHASNEELQASNEELETTNEELQATNEELATVNDELYAKTTALAETNCELEGILANSVEAIALIDPAFHVLRHNRKATRILRLAAGPDRGHLLNSPALASSPQVRHWIEAVFATGHSHVGEVRIDNRTYLMQISANKVRKRLLGAIITLSDVTDLRKAQQAAIEQGRRAENLINTSVEGIVITDSHGTVRICNAASCDFFEISIETILGLPADRLFLAADRDVGPVVRHLAATAPPESESRLEISLERCGQVRHFDVLLSAFTAEDETYRACTLRDITQIRKMSVALQCAKEVAEEASRAKTQFLAKMSHELRTPLNAIVGFSDAILCETFGHLQHERYLSYINDIHASGVHLTSLINDVFDIAKVEAGMLHLREAPVDVVELVSSAVGVVGPVAAKAGVVVVFDFETARTVLNIDERRIRQVLLNVLSNAIKFSARDGRIRLTTRPLDNGGVAIVVQDHGIGMPPEVIARIGTDSLMYGELSTDREEGTGLGLPVSIALMRVHGGTLDIDSAPGCGTTVTLRFGPERVVTHDVPGNDNTPWDDPADVPATSPAADDDPAVGRQ